eukprot:RCo006646
METMQPHSGRAPKIAVLPSSPTRLAKAKPAPLRKAPAPSPAATLLDVPIRKGSMDPLSALTFTPHPSRFWALAVFALLSGLQGMVWFTFSPVVHETQRTFPNVTGDDLDLLDSWNGICYIPMSFLVIWMLTRPRGLQKVVRLGAVLMLSGTLVKCLALAAPQAGWSVYCLYAGQIFNGLLAPCVVAPPSLLSAIWFPHSESTRATAVGVLSNNLGNALAYLLGPAVVKTFGFSSWFFGQLFLAVVAMLSVMWFPVRPPTPPSAAATAITAAVDDDSIVQMACDRASSHHSKVSVTPMTEAKLDIRRLARHSSFRLLCYTYAWSSGGFVAWTSLWDLIMSQTPHTHFSDTFVGLMSFASTLSYIVGGVVAAQVVDRYMSKRQKLVLVVSCAVSLAFTALFSLSVPSVFGARPLIYFGDSYHKAWLVVVATLVGFPNGSAAPVFYEFAAQLTFPASEGSSASALSLFENIGSLVLYQGVAKFCGPLTVNLVYTLGMALCVAMLLKVKEQYRRDEMDMEIAKSESMASDAPIYSPLKLFQSDEALDFESYSYHPPQRSLLPSERTPLLSAP